MPYSAPVITQLQARQFSPTAGPVVVLVDRLWYDEIKLINKNFTKERDGMKLLKQHQFWISLLVGVVLFAGTYPFYHDMYIAELFTALCICLNAFSAVLFSIFLYCKWVNHMDADGRTIFLWFTIMQAVGHGIFAMMNWGSFLFLALSVVVIVLVSVSHFREKKVAGKT